MNTRTHTFLPGQVLPAALITPKQSHSANIVQIKTGQEDLTDCDGIWSTNPKFILGVRTADCAPICLWDNEKFGIVHAGWRGTINGAVENLLSQFELSSNLNVWIGPILPRFEIQKDDCYDLISAKFGDQFFTHQPSPSPSQREGRIIFEFKECLRHLLPSQAVFDERSTFESKDLASWRRDKHFNNGQNVSVIGSSHLF